MKKTAAILIALVLLLTGLFSGCSKNNSNNGDLVDPNKTDDSAYVQSDIKIEEVESAAEANIGAEVEAFVKGEYHLTGTMYSEGDAIPVALATDGTNIQLTASVSEIQFGVLILGDKTYAIQPSAKKYTELSNTLIAVLGLEDQFNVNEFNAIKEEDNDDIASKINQTKVLINGKEGLCNEYVYEDIRVKLYSIGDELIQVENYDNDGKMTMQIAVDEFNTVIPSDQLTLKGLQQVSATQFIASFAAE